MKKRWIFTILAAALGLQCGAVCAYAQGSSGDAADGVITYVDGVEYVNGVEADYDDPGYYKYVEGIESSGSEVTLAQYGATADSLTTTWEGVTYTHNADMAGSLENIYLGVDVSKWNGNIDWTSVEAAGVDFAIVRIGNRSVASAGALNYDPYYETNMKGAGEAGIATGIYFYSQAITVQEAIDEANYVLANLGGYDPELPIFIDYEYYHKDGEYGRLKPSLPAATTTAICNAFCEVIEAAGYKAGIYADKNMLVNHMNYPDIGSSYYVWLANWTTKTSYEGDYAYWQCSAEANVDGIGVTDLDWAYGIYEGDDGNTSQIGGQMVYVDDEGYPDYSYTGFAQGSDGWWYFVDGIASTSTNSVVKDTHGVIDGAKDWWYVTGGKVQKHFTGLADYKNANGWWYISNGKVTFDVNTVAKNKNGWWYVTGGKVQFGFTGLANYSNANGWWYIEGGKVKFDYTGIAENKNGWWYIKDSKVQFGYTGVVSNGGHTYQVTKGRVDK